MPKIKIETIKETRKTKISILVFIWSALLFFINLQYNFLDEFDILIFWLSILFMFGIVTYQIFFLKNNTFVLFEIFIVYLFLHLVYQIGYYGLRGSDSYMDFSFLKTILNDGNFSLGAHVNGWPMLHIFSSAISTLTKIDPLLIAKFLPSLISSFFVLPFYLLSYTIFKDKKIALFSCLVFGSIPQFMNFEALFVRETFAIFIMILFFYILYVSKQKNDYRFTVLYIILVPVITFSHHFTSFIVILLMGTYILVSKVVPYFYRNFAKIKLKFTGVIDIKMIFLIVLVLTVAYWVFLPIGYIHNFLFEIFYDVTGQSDPITYSETIKLGTPIVTLRGKVVFYGFLFFHFFFSLLLLLKLIVRRKYERIDDVSFTMMLYFCLGYGFVALYILGSTRLFPDRILTFGWIFGMLPLVGFIINLKKKILKKILVFILIFFIVFNLCNIDPDYYTGNLTSAGVIATEKEYLIAERIEFPRILYFGYNSVTSIIYVEQGLMPGMYGGSIESMNITYFLKSGRMAVINDMQYLDNLENLKEKSIDEYNKSIEILSYKNHIDIAKIYDLGTIYILHGSWMG